ncbi:hypothetical protein ACOSP7_007164 [Xanthoceras sorbifolium]
MIHPFYMLPSFMAYWFFGISHNTNVSSFPSIPLFLLQQIVPHLYLNSIQVVSQLSHYVDQIKRSRNEKLGQYVSRPLTATTGRDELLATKHDILGSEYRDLVIATTDRDDWLAMKKRKSWQ